MFDDEPDFESSEERRHWRDEKNHEILIANTKQAEIEAEKIDWLNNKTQLQDTLANLGSKISDEYDSTVMYSSVSDGIVTTGIPPDFHTEAMHAERLLWIAERAANICNDSSFRSISEAFFNHLCFLSDEGEKSIANFDKWYEPMRAISLVFFNQADALMQKSNVAEALDKVAEAFLAKGYYAYMLWHEIGGKDKLFQQARDKAKKRHAPTYELKNRIIAYWRSNISTDKSNEFAAELLQKEFPEVAHRTLAGYVAEAKKLPSAGTL